ncbi:MAG: ABC transporter permease subunit [Gammaproteobacteria bacterium]|nr:ABC transporter permease subunit [Gammaproteobacteria bacterium]
MSGIWVIAGREIRSLFLSPLAWIVLTVVEFLLAYLFLGQVKLFLSVQPRLAGMDNAPGVTEVVVAELFRNTAVIALMVIPILTMRLISEERRNQTLTLLFSAPVSMAEIVLGKYLGVMSFFAVMWAMVASMPLMLYMGGQLDLGMYAAGLLGGILLVGAFCAAGLYLSTLTLYPAVAAISTFGLLLLLWVIEWAGKVGDSVLNNILTYISIMHHYESLIEGVFSSADIVYYLLFIITFLILSIRRLDARRMPH